MDGQATNTAAEQNAAGTQQENQAQLPQDGAQKPENAAEKVVPKSLLDSKMSELSKLNKRNKELEEQLKAKMTEDERKAAEASEKDAEIQAMKNELAAFKTESAFAAAGMKSEYAKQLSEAIVGGDISAIVEAVKSAITAIEKDTAAKTAKELLEKGSPNVQAAGGSQEKPDPNLALVKIAAAKPKSTPLSESKWFK